MASIGTEKREIHVEPIVNPIPQREKAPKPIEAPAAPVPTPAREPVGVPTR